MSQTPATRPKPPAGGAAAEPEQYLTFVIGNEIFAIPIQHIREIIEFDGLTPVPLMPGFLRGVINLRGAVVPVIDLAARFGRDSVEISRRTCIIILELEEDDATQILGIIVDAVNEVLTVGSGDIEPPPAFGANIRSNFIDGMLRREESFIILLDVQQVLSVEELATLAEVGAGETASPR